MANQDDDMYEFVNPTNFVQAQPEDANVVGQDIPFPSFLLGLERSILLIVQMIWENPTMEIHERIDSIDTICDKMPRKMLKEYKKWRFGLRKGKTPAFFEKEIPQIRSMLGVIYAESQDLDEFAKSVTRILPVLQNKDDFHKWLESECLEVQPSIDQLMKNKNCAVSLALHFHPDDGSIDLNWTMTIDLIDAIFSDLFVNLCTGENEYGLNEQLENIHDNSKDPVYEVGDVLVALSSNPIRCRIAIMTVKVAVESDYVLVGKARNFPPEVLDRLNSAEDAMEIEVLNSSRT
ncbi:hypothetical protein WR25_20625 [Diploscapter pachys]|uniref:Uncharacterized protein n=1 Tax=Diploscapter pachys TaxID=2018661 RepID=A0A2A2KZX6_9BILA|nr:hypothetical protein WR25_20625 [Diploscapter pachys]